MSSCGTFYGVKGCGFFKVRYVRGSVPRVVVRVLNTYVIGVMCYKSLAHFPVLWTSILVEPHAGELE